jgi:hypothetical protein
MKNTAQNQSSSTHAQLNVTLTLIVGAVLAIVATGLASAQTLPSANPAFGTRGSLPAVQKDTHGGSVLGGMKGKVNVRWNSSSKFGGVRYDWA